jgi:hypothetical protein
MFITKNDGYIVAFGKAENEEATEEYNRLTEVMKSKPVAESGFDYRLKEDLTWELFELPIIEETPTETEATEAELKSQAYDILMGVTE